MRKTLFALLAALAFGAPRLLAQAPAALRDTTAYTAAAAVLRAQPDTGARILSRLPAGWPVSVSTCAAGWCAVRTSSLSGYLPAELLTLLPPRGAPAQAAPAGTPGTSFGVDLSTRLVISFAAGPHVRLAPEVSYVAQKSKSYGNESTIGSYTVDGTDTELWLGLGFYYVAPLTVRPLGAPCLFYIGPRFGLASVKSEQKVENLDVPSDATVERTDTWLGGVLGGELLVSRRFSVGAELQVTKVFPGSETVLGVTTSSVGIEESWVDFETRGTMVLRFYP